MTFGFRIGFHRGQKLQSSKRSALAQPEVVREYLLQECQNGTILDPFDPQDLAHLAVHTSKFGVFPKKHAPGKWRLIIDLSSPDKRSVNDGVDPALCSLSYTRVDQVAQKVMELGPGTQLAKLDDKSAYRIIPVHPDDRPLLGMVWKDAL